MRTLILLLMAVVATAVEPAFAGIVLGRDSKEVAKTKMIKAGFPSVVDQDLVVGEGTLLGHDAFILCILHKEIVVKVMLRINFSVEEKASYRIAKGKYAEMSRALSEKYGAPSTDFLLFDRPYFEGDGYEMTALSAGKARILTIWDRQQVMLRLHRDCMRVHYESPEFVQMKAQEDKADKKKL